MRQSQLELSESNFDRNTFIGFDQEEINNLSTQELLVLRSVMQDYLNSTKLKKRNANFKEAYVRITVELKRRKQDRSREFLENSTNESTGSIATEDYGDKNVSKQKLLGRKLKPKLQLEVPDFLNDIDQGKF